MSEPRASGEMLRIENATKRYGRFTAVDRLNLVVNRGEIFGFLGPNGAGKTTTIRMVAGVLQPSEGRVFIGGDDVAGNPQPAPSPAGPPWRRRPPADSP